MLWLGPENASISERTVVEMSHASEAATPGQMSRRSHSEIVHA